METYGFVQMAWIGTTLPLRVYFPTRTLIEVASIFFAVVVQRQNDICIITANNTLVSGSGSYCMQQHPGISLFL